MTACNKVVVHAHDCKTEGAARQCKQSSSWLLPCAAFTGFAAALHPNPAARGLCGGRAGRRLRWRLRWKNPGLSAPLSLLPAAGCGVGNRWVAGPLVVGKNHVQNHLELVILDMWVLGTCRPACPHLHQLPPT